MTSNFFQKNEPNIFREIEKQCMICSRQFRLGRSQHQCKRCFRAICSDCGKEKVIIFKTGFSKQPHRGCKFCVEEINSLHEYIKNNQIVFGKMSLIGQKWMKKIERNASYLSSLTTKKNQFRRDIFGRMWDSYNYCLREFIGILTFEKHQQEIYQAASQVIKTVLNVYPEQNLESVGYLSMFFLCFASIDKAALLCLYTIQLKKSVKNPKDLLFLYLSALSLYDKRKIQDYVNEIGLKYIQSLSVNFAHLHSSIYIIDKIITRKKIDEVYMFFTLSVDIIAESILSGNYDKIGLNLLLARHGSANAANIKYKKLAEIDNSDYLMIKKEGNQLNNLTTVVDNREMNKINVGSSSFSQPGGVIGAESRKKLDEEVFIRKQMNFQKKEKELDDSSFNLSAISLIQQMKELQRGNPEPSDSKQILALLTQTQQIKRKNSTSSLVLSKEVESQPSKKLSEIDLLKQQLKKYQTTAETAEILKQENQNLRDRVEKMDKQMEIKATKDLLNLQNRFRLEKTEFQTQIRQLKKLLIEKEKQCQNLSSKNEEYEKIIEFKENQIKHYKLELLESESTVRMLKSKLDTLNDSQILSNNKSQLTDSSFSESKVAEMLKQNLKQKNSQIEDLSKKNKILNYQLEQLLKSSREQQLEKKIGLLEKEKGRMMDKLQDLSGILMNEEEETIRLSEENFLFKQILKDHSILFDL